jgi:hypothetical protein
MCRAANGRRANRPAAPAAAELGGKAVSIDEMIGIQALERAAAILPMKPGHVGTSSGPSSSMSGTARSATIAPGPTRSWKVCLPVLPQSRPGT